MVCESYFNWTLLKNDLQGLGSSICTLRYMQWLANGDLLYSRGNLYPIFCDNPYGKRIWEWEFPLAKNGIRVISEALGCRFDPQPGTVAEGSGVAPSWGLDNNLGLDLIPGPGTPYALGWPKKEKKKRIWKRMDVYTYNWITLLCSRNYHNVIIIILYIMYYIILFNN